MNKKPKVVISGSFRKHLDFIQDCIKEFKKLGFEVLSPKSSRAANPGAEFIFLVTDKTKDMRILMEKHRKAIEKADFLYIVCPHGYMGESVLREFGSAQAYEKPIFVSCEPESESLKLFCKVKTPEEIKQRLDLGMSI